MDQNKHIKNYYSQPSGDGNSDLCASLNALRLGEEHTGSGNPSSSQQPPVPARFVTHPLLNQLEATRRLWPRQQQQPPAQISSSRGYFCHDLPAFGDNGNHVADNFQQPPPWMASSSTSPYHRGSAYFSALDAQQQHQDEMLRYLAAEQDGYSPSYPGIHGHGGLLRGHNCYHGSSSIQPRHDDQVRPRTIIHKEDYAVSKEEVRAQALAGPISPSFAMSTETASEHLMSLLDEGDGRVRKNILAGVLGAVHKVMENKFGHSVFAKLLLIASNSRPNELYEIVVAATRRKGLLLRAAKHPYGEEALKALISAVSPYPELCVRLINSLAEDGVMQHQKGKILVQHCFDNLRYSESSHLIVFAIENFDNLLTTTIGSRCLSECFKQSRGHELDLLACKILSNTTEISEGGYGNWFMQSVLDRQDQILNRAIVERVMRDVVHLSTVQFGSYVVEACFLRTSRELRYRVITTFSKLSNAELYTVVHNSFGNFVIQKLLDNMIEDFRTEATALARRIEQLPELDAKDMYAKQVMSAIKKMFARRRF